GVSLADFDANGMPDLIVGCSSAVPTNSEVHPIVSLNFLGPEGPGRRLVRVPVSGGRPIVFDAFSDGFPDVIVTNHPPGIALNRGPQAGLFGPDPVDIP